MFSLRHFFCTDGVYGVYRLFLILFVKPQIDLHGRILSQDNNPTIPTQQFQVQRVLGEQQILFAAHVPSAVQQYDTTRTLRLLPGLKVTRLNNLASITEARLLL